MVKRLDAVVPVRVTRKEKILLRRWARESNADVSKVVRDMIERRRAEESAPAPEIDDVDDGDQARSPSTSTATARSGMSDVGIAA